MKHSKAPWRTVGDRVYDANDRCVTVAYGSIADAQLISAAPELFSSLNSLVRILRSCERNNDGEGLLAMLRADWGTIKNCEKTLQKAEGK